MIRHRKLALGLVLAASIFGGVGYASAETAVLPTPVASPEIVIRPELMPLPLRDGGYVYVRPSTVVAIQRSGGTAKMPDLGGVNGNIDVGDLNAVVVTTAPDGGYHLLSVSPKRANALLYGPITAEDLR